MFRLNILRKRRRPRLTLVLWAPHPAHGDLRRALRKVTSSMKNRALVHSEGSIAHLTSDRLRPLLAEAHKRQRPVIVEAGLLPETKLVPFAQRTAREVRQVLARTDADDVHIVVLVAPHDRLLETVYVRRAEHGLGGSLEELVAEYADVDLSYGEVVRELMSVSQVRSVVPVDWSAAEKSLATVLSQVFEVAVGTVPAELLKPFDRPARPRGIASRRGVRVAAAMHEFTETDKERRLVRRMVRETFPARRLNDVRYLSDEERRRVEERYSKDRRSLKPARKS